MSTQEALPGLAPEPYIPVDLDAIAATIADHAPRDPYASNNTRLWAIEEARGDNLGHEQTGDKKPHWDDLGRRRLLERTGIPSTVSSLPKPPPYRGPNRGDGESEDPNQVKHEDPSDHILTDVEKVVGLAAVHGVLDMFNAEASRTVTGLSPEQQASLDRQRTADEVQLEAALRRDKARQDAKRFRIIASKK